jgi:multiple sugar transport system substrate-binding protein
MRNRVQRFRIGATVLSLAAMAALAAACGGSSSPSKSSTSGKAASGSFTYWTSGWQPAEIATIDAAFAKAHPGMQAKGQYIASSDQYLPKVISAIKTGTQPTVLLDQNPSDLPELAQSGKVIPLDGKLTAETNSLYPGIKSSLFYKGKQLGMAFAGEGDIVLFYNKKDFAAAGISAPPTTWAELTADAQKLTNPAKKHYGFYVPLGDAEFIPFAWSPMLWANGGSLLNSAHTATAFNSPAGVKALTTWVDMIRTQKTAPTTSYAEAGSFDGAPAFASHAVSMIIEGQWALPTFTKAGLDYGVAPFPKGDAGTSTDIGIGVEALLKTTTQQDAVGLEFMKFLSTPAEGAYLASQSGGLPSDPAQLQQPVLKAYIAKNPTYNVFAAAETAGQVRPIDPAYNTVSEDLWTEIGNAVQGKETPAQALQKAAKEGDSALAGNG